MAIYHLSVTRPIARSVGRSSTAASAYRTGTLILDQRTGIAHDYRRRRGVVADRLVLPSGDAIEDRASFWNQVEMHHKRRDAVTAREVVVALPAELGEKDRNELAWRFAAEIASRYEVATDCAVHQPSQSGDDRNHHAHILISACRVEAGGQLGAKAVELDPIHCQRAGIQRFVDWLRPRWQDLANEALAASSAAARIEHRSHATLGRNQIPSVHVGIGAGAARRRMLNKRRLRENAELERINLAVERLKRNRSRLEQSGSGRGGIDQIKRTGRGRPRC